MKKVPKPLKLNVPIVKSLYRSGNRPDPYPPVDPTKLTQSAVESLEMSRQLSLLLQKIRDSRTFAIQLMDAAQRSNQLEVNRLIRTAGVNKTFTIKYNPQGFHLVMSNEEEVNPCCRVEIALNWND